MVKMRCFYVLLDFEALEGLSAGCRTSNNDDLLTLGVCEIELKSRERKNILIMTMV